MDPNHKASNFQDFLNIITRLNLNPMEDVLILDFENKEVMLDHLLI